MKFLFFSRLTISPSVPPILSGYAFNIGPLSLLLFSPLNSFPSFLHFHFLAELLIGEQLTLL